MADLVNYCNADRDIEQALIALKKGAQLLKYGRKGKPKFYPFRVSNFIPEKEEVFPSNTFKASVAAYGDETSLIWISSSGERNLKLASVSRIIPGQRTAVFQRYLRPEKDYLSFSLIYNNGKRSLDLICKDKVEAEIWIAGLKALISSGQDGRSKIDGWNDGGLYFDESKDLTPISPSTSSVSATIEVGSPEVSTSSNTIASPKSYHSDNLVHSERSDVASEQTNMQVKGPASDAFRFSVSSAPSTSSSHGSAQDDCDALGDVYIWGEVICDNVAKFGPDKNACSISTRTDVLIPRPLECNVVLDVHRIACGVRHAALVSRQGEVFSWGEESGGRLGHGVGKDITQPRLVESLSSLNIDFVACGEFHTCAVTMAGELYTWGDGTHNAGLLGHGTDFSHWIPKRILGPLEGLQVAVVTCGPWHTALITSMGQLFTFGDGSFGVLGHGNRESVSYPREVESLSGLRTIAVACGVWHTAAVVEVIVTQSSSSVPSGKLFTWGDGDKNRLGQGDKEPRLKPTCVPSLIDYNFHKIACGHSLTVGLTTSGRVFTMGSTVYGQLGNPRSDGKLPCLVKDKLSGESVEEIACGAYHVAVLTSKNEVYTWGKGANGNLGHGDIEDRKMPTLVEALKDKHVKFIACGSNYSSAICLHKWVSGAEQSQCSSCRQAFGFTRKRHNCYNCGLVHCHACSSRKAVRAALAPNPSKPYRVCDSCFAKLSKVVEGGAHNRRNSVPRLSGENRDRLDKADLRFAKSALPSNFDLIRQLDTKAAKQGKKADTFSLGRSSQVSLSQMRETFTSTAVDARRNIPKPTFTHSGVNSRSASPFSRKPSPPRSATPVPTTSGLSFSQNVSDSLRKTNEVLNQELRKLRVQVESLRNRCELQELELQKSAKKAEEAMMLAGEESAKCKAAKEVIKSLTAQLKDVSERLPPGSYDTESLKLISLSNGEPNGIHYPVTHEERNSNPDAINSFYLDSQPGTDSFASNGNPGASELLEDAVNHVSSSRDLGLGLATSNGTNDSTPNGAYPDVENSLTSRNSVVSGDATQIEAEWIEQYEPAGEDLENIKRSLGGQRTEKGSTRDTMSVDQTIPARPLGDLRVPNLLPRFSSITLTKQKNCTSQPPPFFPPSTTAPSGVGRAFYVNPVRFLDPSSNATSSFYCVFSFTITNTNSCPFGDGFAFLITSNTSSFSLYDGHMGLPADIQTSSDQDSYLAVEFDTSFNPDLEDINDNHIGIDVNNVKSLASIDVVSKEIDLKNGKNLTAWIEYRDSEKMIRVWVGYSKEIRPLSPVLDAKIDLSKQFKEFMHIGFTASNGKGSSIHNINTWRFKTFFGFLPSTMPMDIVEQGDCLMCFPGDSDVDINSFDYHSSNRRILNMALILGGFLVVMVFAAALIVGFVCFIRRRRKLRRARSEREMRRFQGGRMVPKMLSLNEIKSATNGFNQDKIIGEGASAVVYEGAIPSCGSVAIKSMFIAYAERSMWQALIGCAVN
ncbi:hypothetical protein DH2020_035212 [Rehmannia glutinosa]|uniref:FYVE-type domain-containing protein n=1 Tax=Rehmannia glutinosa TaxID=99300 RepID=A0ABR0V740_REHGL